MLLGTRLGITGTGCQAWSASHFSGSLFSSLGLSCAHLCNVLVIWTKFYTAGRRSADLRHRMKGPFQSPHETWCQVAPQEDPPP